MSAPKKIHPIDAWLLLTDRKSMKLIAKGKAKAFAGNSFMLDGQLYQETTEVPASKEGIEAWDKERMILKAGTPMSTPKAAAELIKRWRDPDFWAQTGAAMDSEDCADELEAWAKSWIAEPMYFEAATVRQRILGIK